MVAKDSGKTLEEKLREVGIRTTFTPHVDNGIATIDGVQYNVAVVKGVGRSKQEAEDRLVGYAKERKVAFYSDVEDSESSTFKGGSRISILGYIKR